MNDTLNARRFTADFLRRELVGPACDNPELCCEILHLYEPPRLRYGAGILFPIKSHASSQNNSEIEEHLIDEANASSVDNIPEADLNYNRSPIDPSDSTPDNDLEINLSDQYLPSSIGISALVNVSCGLCVNVSAGIYKRVENKNKVKMNKKGEKYNLYHWQREPISELIEIPAHELLGKGTVTVSKTVYSSKHQKSLIMYLVSRIYSGPKGSTKHRLITFTLINRNSYTTKAPSDEDCFFQCEFSVAGKEHQPCFLAYPEQSYYTNDPDELSQQLLHLHQRTFAIGHGCAASWEDSNTKQTTGIRSDLLPEYEQSPVLPRKIKGLKLRMIDLANKELSSVLQLCNDLADKYEIWIENKSKEIYDLNLPEQLLERAQIHISNCKECLRRIRTGIEILNTDHKSEKAFRLMNEAMIMQHVHYKKSTEEIRYWENQSGKMVLKESYKKPNYSDIERKWRPFQLAFILLNLKSISDSTCREREIVDVIWFPTGGGKTEAYFGLSAFSIFLRRLRAPNNAGTSVLMRYTLRLLTTQQFLRATSLICACEKIRRRENTALGEKRFSIGLWVGNEVTPNSEKSAIDTLNQLNSRDDAVNKFITRSCPWCGAAMGPQKFGSHTIVKGYRKLSNPGRVRHICEDTDCEYSDSEGLPLAIIDEHIYDTTPTLIIGTVDKFAMLSFETKARTLFGIDTQNQPPELIIQDELHLISGPLDSMVGHYETAIDALCIQNIEGKTVRPKILASTATISRAEHQVKGLYGRSAFLFPPQTLKIGDSYFAEERRDKAGRLYIGVFTSGLPSHVTSQVRTMAALLQAPKLYDSNDPSTVDPYWTLVGYFNSLRELGRAATLIRADIREYLNAMWGRLNLQANGQVDRRRFIYKFLELTSRIQSSSVPDNLQQLFEQYDGARISDVVDVCFATNMIQVGLDIPRLSLMTIVGQPKTTSEYIQASSRVGRTENRPGIVVINFNPSKPRDRSHYEHFRSYHQGLYQFVEPTSITAFSAPVRERALHALIIILCRYLGDAKLRDKPSPPPNSELVQYIKEIIKKRVEIVNSSEWPETEALFDHIISKWKNAPPSRYGDFGKLSEEMPLMYPAGSQQHPQWFEWPFSTPTSMRTVDAVCEARPLQRIED